MRKVVVALAALVASSLAAAQDYPNKPLHLLVAFPPGGPVDIIARLVGPKIGEALGQPVVVENKVGASGNVATQEVAKSSPDGYTLLAHSSAYAVNPSLFPNAGYDPAKDLLPIAVVAQQANIILVNGAFPAKTLEELKQAMQKGKLAFASPGTGTTPHLTAENLFHVHWKTDATHVPFKGAGPAVTGVLSGQPPIGCMAGSGPMSNIKSGKLRALAVSSAQRLPQLPEVPTLDELGYPGMEDYTWVGIFVPATTPPQIAEKLNAAVLKAVHSDDLKKRLDALAFEVTAAPLDKTQQYLRSEVVKWAKVVRETGAKVD
ncbi:MAG TPA: tripartite tricarboxylate transporter substrate binding protein [Burkholderiales bacterium]|jgi:tripartite-type tricarboxylate transporter receptor subunit TctC|nr:tripartite tricarboxylate transporter substrate binding protein [Burkholderiales bacterium]